MGNFKKSVTLNRHDVGELKDLQSLAREFRRLADATNQNFSKLNIFATDIERSLNQEESSTSTTTITSAHGGGGGSSSSVRAINSDGTTTVNPLTTLNFSSDDGSTLTNPSSGQAKHDSNHRGGSQAVSSPGEQTITFTAVASASYVPDVKVIDADGYTTVLTPKIPPLTDSRTTTQFKVDAPFTGTLYWTIRPITE